MRIAARFLRLVVFLSGALLLIVLFTPLVCWGTRLVTMRWTDTDRGVLIVLSGSTISYGDTRFIGLNSYWRAVHAIATWRAGHFSTLLLSGADTAKTVEPLLIAGGIPESAIVVEDRATNTRENALYCQPILAKLPGPYVLLTSDYHTFRAARCFAHEHVKVETMPAPDLLKRCQVIWQRGDCFCQLIGEYATIAYYRMHGWI